MKVATITLESITPYSQSRIVPDRGKKEDFEAYEERIWRERMHSNEQGNVIIPPMSIKLCIENAAKYLSIKIPGQGQAKYTKNFVSGILVMDEMVLPIKKNEVPSERLFVPADGKRGGGKRVWKIFPIIKQWTGTTDVYVLDDLITKDVFQDVLKQAGQFIGLGRFRPQNGGFYGRFKIKNIQWREE